MNLCLLDPFQSDFPEVIEEYLEHGIAKCIAFNRRGTLLAAGCTDGACVIWDFDTRGVAKELRSSDCNAQITSVSWSKCGHRLLVAAIDKSLALWDVARGEKIATVMLQQTALHARLNPASSIPEICLACPMSSAPVLVDFTSSTTHVLPVTASNSSESVVIPRSKAIEGSITYTPAAACFGKRGDLVYVGNSKGEILIIDAKSRQVQAIVPVPGAPIIRQIVFSRNGQYLLINSNDRVIRVYENLLPRDNAALTLATLPSSSEDNDSREALKKRGHECLRLVRDFQDAVNKMHWKAACFNSDGEFVVGAVASKGEHKIHIWNRNGQLVRILEGPKEGLTDLAWHPNRPVMASVSLSGVVYLWAKDYTENWSAFAPDFKELEENEEYVEREDEFDMVPDTDKVKPAEVDQNEEIDILTLEKIAAFSDSDVSEDGLLFLPTVPLHDTPEQQNPSIQSSDGLPRPHYVSPSRSEQAPLAVEDTNVKQSGQGHFHAVKSSGGVHAGLTGRVKRKRKLSEKAAEYQAEKGRRYAQKGQLTTFKHKIDVKPMLATAYQDHPRDLNYKGKRSIAQLEDVEGELVGEGHHSLLQKGTRRELTMQEFPTYSSSQESQPLTPQSDQIGRAHV